MWCVPVLVARCGMAATCVAAYVVVEVFDPAHDDAYEYFAARTPSDRTSLLRMSQSAGYLREKKHVLDAGADGGSRAPRRSDVLFPAVRTLFA